MGWVQDPIKVAGSDLIQIELGMLQLTKDGQKTEDSSKNKAQKAGLI